MVNTTNPEKILKRFQSSINKTESCWNWIGGKNRDGYGNFSIRDKKIRSHRFSYEYFKGKIPKGKVIDHLCRNRACVNPDHLEVVTQRENLLRGEGFPAVNHSKTHCPQGHEYTKDNCSKFEKKGRQCVECVKMHVRNAYRRKHPNCKIKV